MASKPKNVGLVGLSAKGSWASRSHILYFNETADYKITALLNSSKEAAEAAVKQYNLSSSTATYDNPTALAQDPNVDIVAISVNVPRHYELLKPALEAKKDIFIEWPLAANLAEAEEVVKLAKEAGVRTSVGLQARQSPSVIKAREIVKSGKLGRILNTTMTGHGLLHGPTVTDEYAYTVDIEAGANNLTIATGHAVDALAYVLGEFENVQANLVNLRPELVYMDNAGNEKGRLKKTAHDHISFSGTLVNGGGLVTVVYGPGTSRTGKGFYWEINGTEGSLVLEGPTGHIQMMQPTVKFVGNEKNAKLEEVQVEVYKDLGFNVGRAWDALNGKGEGNVTTFEDALVRHKMIDAIYRSHNKGTREKYL